jgi:beta-lactamase class D
MRQMQEVVHFDHCHMAKTIAEKVRASVDNYHTIISKDLKMYHICQHISQLNYGRSSVTAAGGSMVN